MLVAEVDINLTTIENQDIMNTGIKKASKIIPHNANIPNTYARTRK